MSDIVTRKLQGRICTVTPDGRFGVIKLNNAYDGFRLAVINHGTKGRCLLMDNLGGKLQRGAQVTITESQPASSGEALIALNVETR